FVKNKQNAMLCADRAQPFEIALWWWIDSSRTNHRLDDDGGDSGRILDLQNSFQFISKMATASRLTARERHRHPIIRKRQVGNVGKQRAEIALVPADAANGEAAETHTVISFCTSNEFGASPLAPCPVIAASDLQRSVDSLRPGIGEEHVVQAFRRLFHQAAGEFKGARVAHSEGGNIVKAPSSVSDRLDDAGLGMACVDA